MKPEFTNHTARAAALQNTFGSRTVGCHNRVLHQIRRARGALFAEARERLPAQERLLHLALNEAEALAWQTRYPHLVFPALADEKVQAVAHWTGHQRLVRKLDPSIVLAA